MFNNNMFGNQQSMRPNFMGAMQRRQQWMDRGAGNMSRPVSNAGYADVGTPKWGVRPAAYPFPSPTLPQNRANSINSMPNGVNAFQKFVGNNSMPNGVNAFQPSVGNDNMPNGVNAFQPPDLNAARAFAGNALQKAGQAYQNADARLTGMARSTQGYLRTPTPVSEASSAGVMGRSVGPPSMANSGIIQRPENTAQAISAENYRLNRQYAANNAPQYVNPTGRAIQYQLAQSNQSLAGSLNQRLNRRFDVNPGATAESNVQRQLAGGMIPTPSGFQPRQDTSEARNVLAGQPMGLDRTMRPLNIPGMHLEGNRMVKDARPEGPGINEPNRGLGGMTPNRFRYYQSLARNAESGGYTAPLGAASNDGYTSENEGYQILNSQARAMKRNPGGVNTGLNSSYANTRMARMARRNGFGSAASFQNFMNQYNARQNRGTTPLGVATTAGALATQGGLQAVKTAPEQDVSQQLKDQPSWLRRQVPDETYNGFKSMGNGIQRRYRSYLQYQNDNGGYIPG